MNDFFSFDDVRPSRCLGWRRNSFAVASFLFCVFVRRRRLFRPCLSPPWLTTTSHRQDQAIFSFLPFLLSSPFSLLPFLYPLFLFLELWCQYLRKERSRLLVKKQGRLRTLCAGYQASRNTEKPEAELSNPSASISFSRFDERRRPPDSRRDSRSFFSWLPSLSTLQQQSPSISCFSREKKRIFKGFVLLPRKSILTSCHPGCCFFPVLFLHLD